MINNDVAVFQHCMQNKNMKQLITVWCSPSGDLGYFVCVWLTEWQWNLKYLMVLSQSLCFLLWGQYGCGAPANLHLWQSNRIEEHCWVRGPWQATRFHTRCIYYSSHTLHLQAAVGPEAQHICYTLPSVFSVCSWISGNCITLKSIQCIRSTINPLTLYSSEYSRWVLVVSLGYSAIFRLLMGWLQSTAYILAPVHAIFLKFGI